MSWADLPTFNLLHVFSFLHPIETGRSLKVCKAWRKIGSFSALWKKWYERDWCITSPLPSTLTPQSAEQDWLTSDWFYKSYVMIFSGEKKSPFLSSQEKHQKSPESLFFFQGGLGRYLGCFSTVRTSWNKIESFLSAHNSYIYGTLRPGVGEEELNAFEAILGSPLPKDFRASYRIHDGQCKNTLEDTGVFGGYTFYENNVNFSLLSLSDIKVLLFKIRKHVENRALPAACLSCIPIIYCHITKLTRFLVVNTSGGHPVGAVIQIPGVRLAGFDRGYFIVANSFSDYLQEIGDGVVSGKYRLCSKGSLSLFPQLPPFAVVRKTREIHVQVSTVFVPEMSSLHPLERRFYFTYEIQMWMDKDAPPHSSQLASRHWVIVDGDELTGNIEEVRGPGVIGLFPRMKPGEKFKYASSTYFTSPTGTMWGTFEMVDLNDPSRARFEIEVPKFHMSPLPFVIQGN